MAERTSQPMVNSPSTDERADERWQPLTPEQVAKLLRGLEIPWWIAGGWALDLFVGHGTRAHNDIEIAVFRDDVEKLRVHLKGWEHFIAEKGTFTPWRGALPPSAHELWSRERGHETWQLEILIEEREGDRWVYRRDRDIGAHAKDIGRVTADGIPYIRPDIQLLYKSKGGRPVDESDLLAVLPTLDPAQKATIAAWISKADPVHRWLGRLK
jgi:hypothetical protein